MWRDIPFENKVIEPQYLMGCEDYVEDPEKGSKALLCLKAGFHAIVVGHK